MSRITMFFSKIIITIAIVIFPVFTYAAQDMTIKVALLENFTLDKYAQAYKNSYYAGIKTAVIAARKKHIIVRFKNFTYGTEPLGIFGAIPFIKEWDANVVIGPHYSNQFLLLKRSFTNTLVLSPYSTDEEVLSMPINFYSLALADSYLAKANYTFINKNFPGRGIYNISQLDCKDCIDTTNNLIKIYAMKNKLSMVKSVTYLGDDIRDIDMTKLMHKYQKNDVIILQPSNDVDANLLVRRITNFLKTSNLVFIYNVDNWGSKKKHKKNLNSGNAYAARSFQIIPQIVDLKSRRYQDFYKYYHEKFKGNPDPVSYTTYRCIMSVVDALHKFPPVKTKIMKLTILDSYLAARKKNKNWYRITNYMIYEHLQKQAFFEGIISME